MLDLHESTSLLRANRDPCRLYVPLPPQARIDGCTDAKGFACFDRTTAQQPIEPEPAPFKANSATIQVKSTIAEKMEKPSSAHARAYLAMKTAKPTVVAAGAEPPPSGLLAETPDPVVIKAKTTIAAQLENPASAEFVEMKRAIRKKYGRTARRHYLRPRQSKKYVGRRGRKSAVCIFREGRVRICRLWTRWFSGGDRVS
ncbi:hypothetical protein ACFIOY_35370 [Bradyrhizobium sp. TZ2]